MIGIALERRIGLDPARRLVAVDDRKLDVHQDQVGPLLGDGGQRLLAVLGLDHLVAGAGQQIAQDLPVVLLVLDHQNALAHGWPRLSFDRDGKRECEGRALPELDSTQILPPCISMMRLEMASPSPVPPLLLGDRIVGLLELLEQLGLVGRGDAGAGVAHRRR